jgi:hypothetical protein
MAGIWTHRHFQLSAINVPRLLAFREHKPAVNGLGQSLHLLCFLFLFSYYIKPPVITESTAGKALQWHEIKLVHFNV